MKDLQNAFIDNPRRENSRQFNKDNLLKYLIMFVVMSVSTLVIPTCGVLKSQAIQVGILAATTFAIIDSNLPNHVYINEFHSH